MSNYQSLLKEFYEFNQKLNLNILIFLCDWKSSIEFGKPITEANWKRSGVYPEVLNFKNKDRTVDKEEIDYVLNFVKNTAKKMNKNELIRLCYSTYPMIATDMDSEIDLIKMKDDYQEVYHLL